MAYVRKTETLVDEIKTKVRKMYQRALEPLKNPFPEIGTPLYKTIKEDVTAAAYSSAPELRGKIPLSWLKSHDSVQAEFYAANELNIYVDINSEQSARFDLPFQQSNNYFPKVFVSPEHCSPDTQLWVDEEIKIQAKRLELKAKFTTLEYQIVEYMGQHASLNTAVKDMPELELYVESYTLDKLRAKAEPRAPKGNKPNTAQSLSIDVNMLASMAIADRITSSN